MLKGCTPLWREAREILKAQHVRTCSDHFWMEVLASKKRTPLWREARFEIKKCYKHHIFGAQGRKKRTQLWREARFEIKLLKTTHAQTIFGGCDVKRAHAVCAKHISKSKREKHTTFGPLLDVQQRHTKLQPQPHPQQQ